MSETLDVRLNRLQRMLRYLGYQMTEIVLSRAKASQFFDVPDTLDTFSLEFDAKSGRSFCRAYKYNRHTGGADNPIRQEIPFEKVVDWLEYNIYPDVRAKMDSHSSWMSRERERLILDFDFAVPPPRPS